MSSETASDWLSVDEWLSDKPIGRGAFYRAIANGEIPHVRVGRKILLRKDSLDRIEGYGARVDEDDE